MCRSIKTLRRADEAATTGELEAAARQYVRKISGYRVPSARNSEAFEGAIAEIAAASTRLMETLGVEVEEGPDRWTPRAASAASAQAHATPPARVTDRPWWVRPGLDIADDGRLRIVGRDAEALAREHGTPLFVYDRTRFAENARALQAALARTGLPFIVRFALKANPRPEILESCAPSARPAAPRASASTPARRARSSGRSSAAGGPTRSATPARTCPSATSTCCWPTAST